MTAAEKYAQLEEAGLERPVCECHGRPKRWNAKDGRKDGGYWKCATRADAATAGWRTTHHDAVLAGKRARINRLLGAGLCAQCGKLPLATADAWCCNPCLDKKVSPLELLKGRRRDARRRMKKRHDRQPTIEELIQSG